MTIRTKLDDEFDRFAARLYEALERRIPGGPPELREKLLIDLQQLCADPETRKSFTRGVFAGDPALPDVMSIRARLRGRR